MEVKNSDGIKVMFVLNVLNPGTGPFQRAFRLPDINTDVKIISCFDTQEEFERKAKKLAPNLTSDQLIGIGSKSRLVCIKVLFNILRQWRPDVVQTNHTFSAMVMIALVNLTSYCPIVVNFEGTLMSDYSNIKRLFFWVIYSYSHGVICVSNAVEKTNNIFTNTLMKKQKRRVIYNGVDLDEIKSSQSFGLHEKLGLSGSDFLIACVSDLKPIKNLGILLVMMSTIVKTHPMIRLVLIGGGGMKNSLELEIKRRSLENNVFFTGQVERSEVYSCLKDIDVFIMPSLVEGLSEATAQAMASKKVVIASNIDPNVELLTPQQSCNCYDSNDANGFANRAIELYEDEGERERWGNYNLERAIQMLDIFNIVKDYRSFYLDLLERNTEDK